LAGWGGLTASTACLRHASGVEDVVALMASDDGRGLLARGLGRSYGDAAQNGGGDVIMPIAPEAPLELDTAVATVRAPAGASLERLLRFLLPRGWRLPVLPGTRFVTVGGAIAADVHGKNHHADGSFGRWVRDLTLVDGTGCVRRLSPDHEPDEFWATVGGMGLTGVITSATLTVEPAVSSRIRMRTTKLATLDQAMDAMESSSSRYHVAWVDAAPHSGFGRAVLDEGTDVTEPDAEIIYAPRRPITSPPMPVNVVQPALVGAFNAAWWRRARHLHESVVPMTKFFHPLDGVGRWPRLYGREGFLQWQIAVPFAARHLVPRVLWRLAASGAGPSLVVLKRFGDPSPGLLSFPISGWTLAVDVPAGRPGLLALLADLDLDVADAGGRVYLAKDARADATTIARMYPRLGEWRAVRARLDPHGRLRSDLARRLALT
jgi:decaprenylphospho-beta-D-ribofuranose 2-oxidase